MARGRRTVLSGSVVGPGLNRSFAAVVFDWDGTAVAGRGEPAGGVRRRVEQLCGLGVHVAVVSGTHLGNIDGQLKARPAGPGMLLLALNRGSELFEVTQQGPVLRHRREEDADTGRLLDEVAVKVESELRSHGLEVELVSCRLNRRKVDLIPEPEWHDPPKSRFAELLAAVTGRLQRSGFDSIEEVVDAVREVARGCGLVDPRISSDAKHVEIGVTDKADSMRQILDVLGRVGVGPGLVLVAGDEFGAVGGVPGSDALMLLSEAPRLTAVSVGIEPAGPPEGVRHLPGGPPRFLGLLDEQLSRARRRRVPTVDHDGHWTLTEVGTDPLRHRVTESLFTIASGGVATRGSVEEADPFGSPLVQAAGVYRGVGTADRLLGGPVWTSVGLAPAPLQDVRILDLRTGVLYREEVQVDAPPVRSCRFASLTLPGVVGLRIEAGGSRLQPGQAVAVPADPRNHRRADEAGEWAVVLGEGGGGIGALARQSQHRDGELRTLERLVALVASPHAEPSRIAARSALATALDLGFDRLLAESRAAWAGRWEAVDVRIPDDPQSELGLRFAIYQLWSLTGASRALAVGARGLSGSGYSGHVFWDADVFVLPALMTIDPPAARRMIRYRLHRLERARAWARAHGHAGARFPWESALTGADVTPTSGFLVGEEVPILTGVMEEHISADVAWAAVRNATWTTRSARLSGKECLLLAETAAYWASRSRLDDDGTAHIERVIGPDEYHEGVDDNAFTNVMARWNLREAALRAGTSVPADERARWLAIADALVDGYDEATGHYEQFRGYFDLERLLVSELAEPPVAADVLVGRERISGSQVIKQPDVLMLHHLVPQEMAPGSLGPNLDFYGPRTAHGSSLSPAIMASLLARAGRPDEGLELLRIALNVDIEDRSGITAVGTHIGAAGGSWQALLFGFLGAEVRQGVLHLDPALPTAWPTLEARFRCLGREVRVAVDSEGTTISASGALPVCLSSGPVIRVPGHHQPTTLSGGSL